MIAQFVIAGFGSFGVAAAIAWLVARNASRLGLMDIPNARSSHETSTPRGGGFGVVAGVAIGILLLAVSGAPPSQHLGTLLVGTAAIAALGAIDDLRSVRAAYRLVAQLLIASAVVAALGGVARLPLPAPFDVPVGWAAVPMAVVWLVGVTNLYNFMDGIDGLAAGQAVASSMGIALAAWSFGAVQFAGVLAAAAVGFLVLNRPPARVFLGDVGSTSVAFAIAGMPLLAPVAQRPMAVFAVAVGLSLFLLDPIETLVRLARYGHRFGTAHRSHSYQLLASTRDRHGVVAGGLVAAGFVLAIGGGLSYREHWEAWPVAALALCAFAGERYLAGRRNVPSIANDPPTVESSSR